VDNSDVLISFSDINSNDVLICIDYLERFGIDVEIDKIGASHYFDTEFHEYISNYYLNKTNYCIIFISQEYRRNMWDESQDKKINIMELNKLSEKLMLVIIGDVDLFEYDNSVVYTNDPIWIAKIYLANTRKTRDEYQLYSYLFPEEIDSFEKIRSVSPSEVKGIVPLKMLESDVKKYFCEILQELDIQPDWGGEKSDQVSEIYLNGRRTPAAFMFKGRGTPGKLTIDKCGENGDQLVRLIREPAVVYFIQHVDAIDSELIIQFRLNVEYTARLREEKLFYCHIDGVDTARLFKSYEKI